MSRTRRLAPACLVLPLLALVSACGGGASKPTTATSSSPGGVISGPQTLVDRLPPIDQFPRLRPISQPNVITSPSVWVASNGIPGIPGRADASRLAAMGFLGAVGEELGSNLPQVTAEVDAQVEQFRGAAAADTELSYRLSQARELGHSPGYTFGRFAVAGVPGAVGYSIKQGAGVSDAVAFTSATAFYLLQSVLPVGSGNIVTNQQLAREAASWYRHLQ